MSIDSMENDIPLRDTDTSNLSNTSISCIVSAFVQLWKQIKCIEFVDF